MSEVLDPPLTHPVRAAIDALSEAMADLARVAAGGVEGDVWTLSSDELVSASAEVHRLGCQADAVLHALVREVDVRGAAVEAGAPSTAAWLRHRLRMHPAGARRLVATARGLHDAPAGPLVSHVGAEEGSDQPAGRAALRAAFGAGDISAEHAQVAVRTLDDLPPVDADTEDRAAALLAEQALVHDPKALAHLGRHLRHALDPDAGDRLTREEEHSVANRFLDVRMQPDGSARVAGHFDPELTAALLTQLDPLAAPRPAVDGVKDQRTVSQRRADALAELLRRYAGAELGPSRHGAATTVTVTLTLETLRQLLGCIGAWLDLAGPVSAATARRLACDARIIPVVLGSTGEPLDVGRSTYAVTQAIWRALVARDRGCAFAGCDRLPDWCEAHHRIHWEDGGETSVENCCLLCTHHHRAVHHHGWDLVLRDGHIWTIPPPWVDPARTPRRNTGRAQLADLSALLATTDRDPGDF